jgi:hypothetical protein
MVRSRWPVGVAGVYLAVTIIAWALLLSSASELGLKIALVLGLPWSLLLAESRGSSTTAFLLFGAAVLDAGVLYLVLWLFLRQHGASQRGSAAA